MKANQEIEIKLRVENAGALLKRLRQIGAKWIESVREENTLFDTSEREFQRRGAILRLRREIAAEPPGKPGMRRKRAREIEGVLTFKCQPQGKTRNTEKYKIREEIEYRMENADRIERLFARLRLRRWFRYEKYRTKYSLRRFPGLQLDLDETPIGVFMELEGRKRAIDIAARSLGYGEKDYIAASYLDLYFEYCQRRGTKPGNMVFRTKNN